MPLIVRVPQAIAGPSDSIRWLNVLDPRKTAVQRELRRSGLAGYEPATQSTLLALMEDAPEGGCFIDIGAHIGVYSSLVAAVFRSASPRVIAVEPTPATAALARKLARVNGLDIDVVETAISDRPGEATLYLSDKAETSNSLNEDFREHAEHVVVATTTLDALIEERGLRPHLIKIDVETHEHAVLRGAWDTIERFRPWIVVEVLDSSDAGPLSVALDHAIGLGYTLYPLVPEADWTAGHPRQGTRAQEGYRDWLLAPTPIDDSLADRVVAWRQAIRACAKDTNAIVPRGCTFARGWNLKESWTLG